MDLLKRELRTIKLYIALVIAVLVLIVAQGILFVLVDMWPLLIVSFMGLIAFGLILRSAFQGLREVASTNRKIDQILSDASPYP